MGGVQAIEFGLQGVTDFKARVIAVLAAPLIFRMYSLLTSSSVDAGKYHTAGTLLARIFLVQIFFYGLNAIGAAVLNARRRFFAAAWAPALSNLAIIASLLLVPGTVNNRVPQLDDVINNDKLRWTLGLGATIGIAVMAVALVPALAQASLRFRFNPSFGHPAVRSLRSLSKWALGYVVANQIAIIVIRNLLRGGSGDEDAYTKAFTWFVLPHGLLAVSITTTFLPELASAIKRKDQQAVIDRSSLGIRLIALVTLPAGFGLFVLRRAIVGAAFQHGKFTAANSLNTSRALAGFALGLVGFSIYLFVLRIFYAHQDARTPFVINVGENLLNIVLAVIFVDRWGLLGLGLSFALAYLIAALWALQVLRYKIPAFPLADIIASLWRMALAALVMGEVVWVAAQAVGSNSGSGAVIRVVVSTVVGTATYVGMLLVLKSPELTDLRSRLRPSQTATTAE